MRGRRLLIVGLTFLAGLYFILDFFVPPTLPIASQTRVMSSVRMPSLEVEDAVGRRIACPMGRDSSILVPTRDVRGAWKPATARLREVGVGSKVTVRTRKVTVARVLDSAAMKVETAGGQTLEPAPGEQFFAEDEEGGPVQPVVGETYNLEIRDVTISAIDRGSVFLVESPSPSELRPARSTVLLRLTRGEPPQEIELSQARVGDTLRIGPGTLFADQRDTSAQLYSILETMAIGMGLLSLAIVNGRRMRKKEKGWYEAPFFFAAVVLGVVTGIYKYADPGSAERAFSDTIIFKIITAAGSSIFSLLAFYMASAAYRAFRIRNVEAALMMGAAILVMLGQTPFGAWLTAWLPHGYEGASLPSVAAWILRVLNTAVFRGLIFGIMLGAIATAVRYWLSLERTTAMREG